jgi:hypothetical protein
VIFLRYDRGRYRSRGTYRKKLRIFTKVKIAAVIVLVAVLAYCAGTIHLIKDSHINEVKKVSEDIGDSVKDNIENEVTDTSNENEVKDTQNNIKISKNNKCAK